MFNFNNKLMSWCCVSTSFHCLLSPLAYRICSDMGSALQPAVCNCTSQITGCRTMGGQHTPIPPIHNLVQSIQLEDSKVPQPQLQQEDLRDPQPPPVLPSHQRAAPWLQQQAACPSPAPLPPETRGSRDERKDKILNNLVSRTVFIVFEQRMISCI